MMDSNHIYGHSLAGKWLLYPIMILVLLFSNSSAQAQSASYATVSQIVTDQFPTITFNLTVHDEVGAFINHLTIDDVHVREDDNTRNIDNIKYFEPGLQIIFAINSAPAFGYYAGEKIRFDLVRQSLVTWATSRPVESTDDFSLVTTKDALAYRVSTPTDFLPFIENYKPNFNTQIPALSCLSKALDLAMDTNPRPNMQRVILYITPLPSQTELTALQDLTDRAVQLNVHVFVWLIAYSNYSTSNEAATLQQLAARTNGEYFLFSGLEKLPDLEFYFAPLRGLYTVTYSSIINKSGTHSLSAIIKTSNGELTSAPQTINLTITPPNPFFLSPPSQIERSWLNDTENTTLQPQNVDLNFLVEFPDGYERQLKAARLYIDGVLVQKITDLTTKQFVWSLPDEKSTAQHTIQVEVVDILDLTGKSIEVPVQITIKPISRTRWQVFMSNIFTGEHLVVFIAVLLSAAALITILILSSRGYRIRLSRKPSRKETHDPVTQPVFIRGEKNKPLKSPVPEKPVSSRSSPQLLARFVPADQAGRKGDTENSLIVNQPDITLGRDPRQVDLVISAPSVSPLHARLHLTEDGYFILSDADSVAGTWVNYAPISSQGIRLEHNDLVNFGKASFRFETLKPNQSSNLPL
jgi:flagellar basal body-associated protein FliL